VATVRILPDVPVIFADVTISQSWATGVTKFFLGRVEGDPDAKRDPITIPVAQIVMPAEGFVSMVAFFEHRIKAMIASGSVSQESFDKARQFWVETEER
jgi:hypothetical protein